MTKQSPNEAHLLRVFGRSCQRIDQAVWEITCPGVLSWFWNRLVVRRDVPVDVNRAKSTFLAELVTAHPTAWLIGDASWFDQSIAGVSPTSTAGRWRIADPQAVSTLYREYLYVGNWQIACSANEPSTMMPGGCDLFRHKKETVQYCLDAKVDVLIDSFHDDTIWRVYLSA